MHDLSIMFADEDVPRARLALLLEHFSELSDDRESPGFNYAFKRDDDTNLHLWAPSAPPARPLITR